MIYIDKAGHLIANTLTELHTFAASIGLKREWFQDKERHPHYDCTTQRKRNKAVECGAKLVDSREIVKILSSNNTISPKRLTVDRE